MTASTGRTPAWRHPAGLARLLLSRGSGQSGPAVAADDVGKNAEGYLDKVAPTFREKFGELRGRADELARSGAVDEGNGNVFDGTIRSWVDQWGAQVDEEHDARQQRLRLRLAEAEAYAARCREDLTTASADLDQFRRQVDGLLYPADPAARQRPVRPSGPAPTEGM